MESKKISLMFVSILALVMAMSFASAAISIDSTESELDFSSEGQSEDFDIEEDNNANINITSEDLKDLNSINGLTFSLSNQSSKNSTNSVNYELTLDNVDYNQLDLGRREFSGNVTIGAVNASNSSDTGSTDLTVVFNREFCRLGPADNSRLDLHIDDVENLNDGEGSSDHDEWRPLDTIEVEVEFDNHKNRDLDDVIIEFGLFEEGTNNNVADDLIWESRDDEEFDAGDVDEGDDMDHTFVFRVDPSEFDSDGDYEIRVKSYEDGNEANLCTNQDYRDGIEIGPEDEEENMVIIDEQSYPATIDATCGQEVSFQAEVWNIGDEDFEDQVSVFLNRHSLDMDTVEQVLTGDLDQGDSKTVSFSFTVPKGIGEGTHILNMDTRYDYDTRSGNYDEFSDRTFPVRLDTQGQCHIPQAQFVGTNLDQGSTPTEGETFFVSTSIVNNGTEDTSYEVGLRDHQTWISESHINPEGTFTLEGDGGQDSEQQVQISLNVRDGVTGNRTLFIQTFSDGELVREQPVQVQVQSAGGDGIDFSDITMDSLVPVLLALIGAAIIAIAIILIIRMTREKKGRTRTASDF